MRSIVMVRILNYERHIPSAGCRCWDVILDASLWSCSSNPDPTLVRLAIFGRAQDQNMAYKLSTRLDFR